MELKDLSNYDLEDQWQLITTAIQGYITSYYKTNNESYKVKAEELRVKQDLIQKELTRRH